MDDENPACIVVPPSIIIKELGFCVNESTSNVAPLFKTRVPASKTTGQWKMLVVFAEFVASSFVNFSPEKTIRPSYTVESSESLALNFNGVAGVDEAFCVMTGS